MDDRSNRRFPGQTRFALAGMGLAGALIAALLWLGSLRPPFNHFQATPHETCEQPVSLRAEGYNLLGGTRYGADPGDPGDDVELALIDICDPAIQLLPNGEERLWFWLEVQAVGQTFPYYAWGIPDEDLRDPNANEWRDPVDPLWNYRAFTVVSENSAGDYWDTGRGELCPLEPDEPPGIALFIDSVNDFRIPLGRARAAWVCVRMGFRERLPDVLQVSIRPELARLTRWVDKTFTIRGQAAAPDSPSVIERGYQLPVLHTQTELCYHAEDTHPESILPGGGCPRTAE